MDADARERKPALSSAIASPTNIRPRVDRWEY